jgi:hypothetical protein
MEALYSFQWCAGACIEGSAAFPVLQLSGQTDSAEQSGYWRVQLSAKHLEEHHRVVPGDRKCLPGLDEGGDEQLE